MCPSVKSPIIEPHIHLQGLVCGYFTASPIVTILFGLAISL
jgi:hypothetical protein